MSELDELRQKRLMELQALQQQQQNPQDQFEQQMKNQQMESQIKGLMRKILTPEAHERLGNIRLARPDYARQIEILLIQLFQSGRIVKFTDEQLRHLLSKIKSEQRETKIERI